MLNMAAILTNAQKCSFNMAAILTNAQKCSKNLPQNRWADIPETWHVASMTLAHQGVTLTYFTVRSILEILVFTWGKVKMDILETIAA